MHSRFGAASVEKPYRVDLIHIVVDGQKYHVDAFGKITEAFIKSLFLLDISFVLLYNIYCHKSTQILLVLLELLFF